jgi:hypothetical protein
MAEAAARLVDEIVPTVPVRQWVLSLPFALRYRMAFDAALTTEVLRVFLRAVFASLRRRARYDGAQGRLQCGAVTFIQRAGDALNLNPHFHSLVLDGVYEPNANGPMRFHCLRKLDDAEVAWVTTRIAHGIERLLTRRGLGPEADPSEADPLARDEPLLAGVSAASIRRRIAAGPRAGRPLLRLGDHVDADDLPQFNGSLCANWNGVSLHAAVRVPAHDRRRLEKLVRYVARSPVSLQRLSRRSDGCLVYKLKRRWRDGTTHVVFEPADFITKLAAMVPPPRAHVVRYHGVLAPCASHRDQVVPATIRAGVVAGGSSAPRCDINSPSSETAPSAGAQQGCDPDKSDRTLPEARANPPPPTTKTRSTSRLSWADLMQRVFALDVLVCPRCSGRMRVLATICGREAKQAILECLGLPARAPPTAAAQPEETRDVAPAAAQDFAFDV